MDIEDGPNSAQKISGSESSEMNRKTPGKDNEESPLRFMQLQ